MDIEFINNDINSSDLEYIKENLKEHLNKIYSKYNTIRNENKKMKKQLLSNKINISDLQTELHNEKIQNMKLTELNNDTNLRKLSDIINDIDTHVQNISDLQEFNVFIPNNYEKKLCKDTIIYIIDYIS